MRDFDNGTLQKRYVDEAWAPLDSGIAVLQDRVLEQVDEHLDAGCTHLRVQSGVPGLDMVYGVSRQEAYEPAGRAPRPTARTVPSARRTS